MKNSVPCSSSTDAHGTTFSIPAAPNVVSPAGRMLRGFPGLDVWWSRDLKLKAEETLVIRQEYPERSTADVLELTVGQAYDLIDALNKAVEKA